MKIPILTKVYCVTFKTWKVPLHLHNMVMWFFWNSFIQNSKMKPFRTSSLSKLVKWNHLEHLQSGQQHLNFEHLICWLHFLTFCYRVIKHIFSAFSNPSEMAPPLCDIMWLLESHDLADGRGAFWLASFSLRYLGPPRALSRRVV